MFALLISLPGWGQNGREPDPTPCPDPSIPMQVQHFFYQNNGLPCLTEVIYENEDQTYETNFHYIVITRSSSTPGYNITSTSPITVEQVLNPPSLPIESNILDVVYRVKFHSGGWTNLTITPSDPTSCEIPTEISVPVLCSCPTQSYNVLGIPGDLVTIDNANLSLIGSGVNYVIGDLEFNGSTGTLFITDKKFKVLGRNAYFETNQPGGLVYGPTITLTTKNRSTGAITNNGLVIEKQAGDSYLEGDPCFGMWGGIVVDDSIDQSVSFSKINIKTTKIADAYVGVKSIPGSNKVLSLSDVNIDACMFGIVSTRDGISELNNVEINYLNKSLFKPFDYSPTGYSPNRIFDIATSNLKAKFYTQIGLWQASDRVADDLSTFAVKIKDCIIGVKYGNGINLNSTNTSTIKGFEIASCHFTGFHILALNPIKISDTKISIKELYDGNYTTYQANGLLSQFSGNPMIENLNNVSQRFTNHYGIFSQLGHPLSLLKTEIVDKTVPKQTNYNDRPIGMFCKNIRNIEQSKFIFNDNHNNSPLGEGDITTAEVRAIGVIADAVNYSASVESKIKESWFRNLKTAVVFRNTVFSGTNKLTVGCNYFQNVHTGFDLTAASSFTNDLGDATAPCGNRFTWNDTYYGLPNVAPNDCRVVIGNNTSPTYYGFSNEEIIISLGNLTPNLNGGQGIKQGLPGASCPNAVRDPIPPKVKPVSKPFEIDPNHFGIYNLLGRKVAEINSNEGSLPNGFYLKLDENGKTIFSK